MRTGCVPFCSLASRRHSCGRRDATQCWTRSGRKSQRREKKKTPKRNRTTTRCNAFSFLAPPGSGKILVKRGRALRAVINKFNSLRPTSKDRSYSHGVREPLIIDELAWIRWLAGPSFPAPLSTTNGLIHTHTQSVLVCRLAGE